MRKIRAAQATSLWIRPRSAAALAVAAGALAAFGMEPGPVMQPTISYKF
jgi:hypothetical protein